MTQGIVQGERALFLSYAEEDGATAAEIAERLGKQGFKVFLWQYLAKGGRFIKEIEDELNAADAFLALLSPHFLDSPWCHRETELAILREHDLQTNDPSSVFIHVVKISETRIVPGFLGSYQWIDMTAARSRDEALHELVGGLGPDLRSRQVHQARRKWVFVSYVRDDSAAVDRIAAELRAWGVAVWLDRTELEVGDRWKDAIRNAIREGEFFIACFSSAYSRKASTYMNEELDIAISRSVTRAASI
jgi:hypothetical protein